MSAHNHHHNHSSTSNTLRFCLYITFIFALVEALVGYTSGSLALLSDAGHMLSDSFSLGLALVASIIATRPPSHKHSYGFGRAEVLAGWSSSLIMILISLLIIFEAVERLQQPHLIATNSVMLTATLGLLLNIVVAYKLHRGEKNLNTRAALLHVLSDLFASVAVLVSGTVVYFTDWAMIDPLLSIGIAVLLLISSFSLLKESIGILMEGVPKHITLPEVNLAMAQINGVITIHHLHIWTLSSHRIALSAHIVIQDMHHWNDIKTDLIKLLTTDFTIQDITLQPECQEPHHANTPQ